MARISLYISDDLKARMDAAGDAVNWSDTARPALVAAVAAYEHSKGGTMDTAIERLRTSRRQAEQNAKNYGDKEGRIWAADRAEYQWLQQLSRRRTEHPAEEPRHALVCALDLPEEMDAQELEDVCYPLSRSPSDQYLEAFVKGAVEFFEQVREEVEHEPVVVTRRI